MKTTIITFAALALLFFSSCENGRLCEKGKGANVTQTLELPPITGFDLCIASDVNLTYGEEQSVSVTAPQNVIDNLLLNVSGDIWTIEFDKCMTFNSKMVVDITLPSLTRVGISGSGDVVSTNHFPEQGNLDIDISGSGDIDLSTDVQSLSTKIAGSGDVVLDGSAIEADYRISGSGNIRAYDFLTNDVTIKISGSGDIRVNAAENLDVSISGSGDVYYTGTPSISVDISGSGDLHNAN